MRNRFNLGFVLLVLAALCCVSCTKKDTPESVRTKRDRVITIINQTGNEITSYRVNVASSGVLIVEGTNPKDTFFHKIGEGFNNDTDIEVVLVDEYTKVYAKTFKVPLEGNTDAPITEDDRKSEGWLIDKGKDLVEWVNEHK